MPYVTCKTCALPAYTAARWTTADECHACGTPLAGAPRAASPVRDAPAGIAAAGAPMAAVQRIVSQVDSVTAG